MTAKRQKTARKSAETARNLPAKIVHPNANGGALYTGGVPGNRGGGRPANEVQSLTRLARDGAVEAFVQVALPELRRLAAGAEAERDRIAASAVLTKAGLSEAISKTDVRRALGATVEAIRASLTPETAESLLVTIRPHWTAL